MRKEIFILVSYTFFFTITLQAQCPDEKVLLSRINYLKDTLKPSLAEQISLLLPYIDSLKPCSGKNDSVQASLYRRLGALYFLENDYSNSLLYYSQFINITVSNVGTSSLNSKDLMAGYYWLSVVYDSLNMVAEKWKALDNCIDIAERIKTIDRSNLTSLWHRLLYFLDLGDYYRCLQYAIRCETLGMEYSIRATGDERRVGQEYILAGVLMRVEVLMILKEYDSAEVLLVNKVYEVYQRRFKNWLGMIYEKLAMVHEHKGDYKTAFDYLNKASIFYQKGQSEISYKRILNTIGRDIYFDHCNDIEKAFFYYRKALKVSNYKKSQYKEFAFLTLNILNNIANAYLKKGFFDSAFHYYQLAIKQISPGTKESDFITSQPAGLMEQEKIYYRINLLIDQGIAYREFFKISKRTADIHQAVHIFKGADYLLDWIRKELTESQSKLFWRSYAHRLYENAIEACYLEKDAAGALYFFEKSRAVLLYDQLNEQRWLGEKDIQKLNEKQRKLRGIEEAMSIAGLTSDSFNDLQSRYFICKHELDLLQKQLKDNNPFYYQNYLDTNLITLRQVKINILQQHEALVELFAGDSAIYILTITTTGEKLAKIEKEVYDRTVKKYIEYISNRGLLNEDYDGFIKISRQLCQLIFSNIHFARGRIIISPDGKAFPFEALVTDVHTIQPIYFLEDYAVSYTYSARFLLNSFDKEGSSVNDFIGFAPIQYTYNSNLPDLIGSNESLKNIGSYFDQSEKLVGKNASRNSFIQHYSEYKIAQLFTHASDSSSKGEPVIWFADSALYLSDLVSEKRPLTRLIVLSACQTGTGHLYKGEGVFSFNRGFAALGIPAAITNLWSVDSKSTYELTELFYKYLADGLPTDIALQRAKLHFIQNGDKEKGLPYYWAAPILVGNAEVIQLSHSFRWNWLLAGVVGISAIGIWYFLRRRRKLRSHD